MWPFKKKNIIKKIDKEDNDRYQLPILSEKNFDWAHYQAISEGGIHTAYQDEYNFLPTVRVLKSLYAREPWVSFCINAIARQFTASHHVLAFKTSDGTDEQIITRHPLLTFLSTAGQEDPSFFTSNNVIDLILTGNAYVWYSPDLKNKKRLPAERVDLAFQNGVLTSYELQNMNGDLALQGGAVLSLNPDEIIHFMMPNPFTPWVGM